MSKKNAPLSRKEEEEKKASENPSPQMMLMKKGSMFAKFDDLAGFKRKAFASMYKKKSTVSQPGDPSEVQADAVAKAVTEGNANAAQMELQNDISSGEITAKASDVSIETPSGFEEKIEKMKGGGLSLPDDTKEHFEDMLGTGLDEVRLHTGTDAGDLAKDIGALAFASGDDIFYPGDLNDEELLAHEVVHTVQSGNDTIDARLYRQDDPSLVSKSFVSKWFQNDTAAQDVLHGKFEIHPNDQTNAALINRIKQAMHELEMMKPGTLTLNGIYDLNLSICVYKFKSDSFTSFEQDPARDDYRVTTNWRTTENLKIDSEFIEKLDGYMYAKELVANLVYPDTHVQRPVYSLKPGRNTWAKNYDLLLWVKAKNVNIYDEENANSDVIDVYPGEQYIDVMDEYYWAKTAPWILVEYNGNRGYMDATAIDFDKFIWNEWGRVVQVDASEYETRGLLLSGNINTQALTLHGDSFKAMAGFSSVSYLFIGNPSYNGAEASFFALTLEYNGTGYSSVKKVYLQFDSQKLGLDQIPLFDIVPEISGNSSQLFLRIKLRQELYDAPMKPSYMAGWTDKNITITDSVKNHSGWTPPAREHTFTDLQDNKELGWVTVVPHGSLRNDVANTGNADEVNYDQLYFQQYLKGEDSLMLCIALVDEMITPMPELSPDDPFAGKTIASSQSPFFLLKPQLDKDVKDNTIIKKYHAPSVVLHKYLSKTKNMITGILPLIYTQEPEMQGIRYEAVEIQNRLETACFTSYINEAYAKTLMQQIDLDYRFLIEKMTGLQLQQGGGMKTGLYNLVSTFNNVTASPDVSGYYFNVRQLVDKNLREFTTAYKNQRTRYFQNTNVSQSMQNDPGYPTISQAHLSFLVTLLGVECSLYNFKLLEANVSGNWFYGSNDDSAIMATRHKDFQEMLARINNAIDKPDFTLNYLLETEYQKFKALFYEDRNFSKAMQVFNKSLEKNYKFLSEQESSNEWVKSILINVVIFIVAEIATMGLATVASPAFIAAMGGVTVFRIVGTAVIATTLSQGVNYMRFGTTGGNFFEELGMNLLTAGVMRYVGLRFNMWKPSGFLLRSAKWGAEQAVVLGSLQAIAEAHHLIKEGRVMNRDERLKALFGNAFLHFSSKITNHLMKNPIERAYTKVGMEVVMQNMEKLNPYRTELNTMHAEIARMFSEMTGTMEFNGKLIETIISYRAKGIAYQEMVLKLAKKTMNKSQVKEMRKQYEAENKKLDDFIASLSREMQLQGFIVNELASDSGWIEPIGNDTYLIDQGDVASFKKHYTDNKGTFELVNPDNPNLFVATLNGKKTYFKATTGVENLGVAYRQISFAKSELSGLFRTSGEQAVFEPAGYKSLVRYAFYRKVQNAEFNYDEFQAEVGKIRKKSLDNDFTADELLELQNAFRESEMLLNEAELQSFLLRPTRREFINANTTSDPNRLELNTAFGNDIFMLSDLLTVYNENALLNIVRHNTTTVNMPQAEFMRMMKMAASSNYNTSEANIIDFMTKANAERINLGTNAPSWGEILNWTETFKKYPSGNSVLPFYSGSHTVIVRTNTITVNRFGTVNVNVSEYNLYHYKKGHTWENFSFDPPNYTHPRNKSTFWWEGITDVEILDILSGILQDPNYIALVNSKIATLPTTQTFVKVQFLNYHGVDYQIGIDFNPSQMKVSQFHPINKNGVTEITSPIIESVKHLLNL